MQDINNFANLMEVNGRSFADLQAKLIAIPGKASILKIEKDNIGKWYAVVQLAVPSKSGRKAKDDNLTV